MVKTLIEIGGTAAQGAASDRRNVGIRGGTGGSVPQGTQNRILKNYRMATSNVEATSLLAVALFGNLVS
jgi:hypothetical protein